MLPRQVDQGVLQQKLHFIQNIKNNWWAVGNSMHTTSWNLADPSATEWDTFLPVQVGTYRPLWARRCLSKGSLRSDLERRSSEYPGWLWTRWAACHVIRTSHPGAGDRQQETAWHFEPPSRTMVAQGAETASLRWEAKHKGPPSIAPRDPKFHWATVFLGPGFCHNLYWPPDTVLGCRWAWT